MMQPVQRELWTIRVTARPLHACGAFLHHACLLKHMLLVSLRVSLSIKCILTFKDQALQDVRCAPCAAVTMRSSVEDVKVDLMV